MLKKLMILAVRRPEEQRGSESDCYLTLSENTKSDNRYYVRLFYDIAEIDWQVGDIVMLEIGLCAYKTKGLWQLCIQSDSIELTEIDKNSNILNFKKNEYKIKKEFSCT